MLFSVIIPAYNCEETIENTVDSIAESGIIDYEILIIDDGSTDKTGSICDSLSQKMPSVRCIHQINAGVSAARNCGIENSQGEYILFFDADDSLDSNSLCNAVSTVEIERPDMLIFGMRFDYYHRGRVYRNDSLIPPLAGSICVDSVIQNFEKFYESNSLSSVCNKIFSRASIVKANASFDEDMILMEDFMFSLKVLPCCSDIYCLQEPIYHYRQSEDEKKTYRRLCSINDLPDYLLPFSRQIELLGVSDSDKFMDNLYKMLLEQRLYYASYEDICNVMTQHMNSGYGGINIEDRPLVIFLRNKKSHLRHRIAVIVKTLISRLRRG